MVEKWCFPTGLCENFNPGRLVSIKTLHLPIPFVLHLSSNLPFTKRRILCSIRWNTAILQIESHSRCRSQIRESSSQKKTSRKRSSPLKKLLFAAVAAVTRCPNGGSFHPSSLCFIHHFVLSTAPASDEEEERQLWNVSHAFRPQLSGSISSEYPLRNASGILSRIFSSIHGDKLSWDYSRR